jgi:hypothetical protein
MVGAPDWSRAVLNAGKLLATVAAGTTSTVVTVPTNARVLYVAVPYNVNLSGATCVGATTGLAYEGILYPAQIFPGAADNFLVFDVSSQLDAQVTISLFGFVPLKWYVYSSTSINIVSVPDIAAASETDFNTGKRGFVVLAYESGAATFSSLHVDANQSLYVIDQQILKAMAAPGAAVPADAVMVGGNNGGFLRAINVDVSGNQTTIDQNLKNVIAALGAVIPADAALVGLSDGTDIRAASSDVNGRQVPLVPNLSSGVKVATTVGVTAVAAPGAGHNYLFGIDVEGLTAADILTVSTVAQGTIAIISGPLNTTNSIQLNGFAVNQLVTITTSIDTANVVVRYAAGP